MSQGSWSEEELVLSGCHRKQALLFWPFFSSHPSQHPRARTLSTLPLGSYPCVTGPDILECLRKASMGFFLFSSPCGMVLFISLGEALQSVNTSLPLTSTNAHVCQGLWCGPVAFGTAVNPGRMPRLSAHWYFLPLVEFASYYLC